MAARRLAEARPERRYHHGDLRRALLDATLELVREKGPEGFTLRAAARAAGVSDAAPYHHFEDKEALLAAVAEEGFRRLHSELEHAAQAHESPSARALGMGVAYVLFAAAHPSHFRVMVGRHLQRPERFPSLAQAAAEAFQLVRDTLLEAIGAERAAELPADQVIYGAWGLVHGLAFLAIDGHLGAIGAERERLEQLVSGVLGLFARS
jgi:AcrR family transcriptional regulator